MAVKDEYKCVVCGNTYDNVDDEDWNDGKAKEECFDKFGLHPDRHNVGYVMVCDDCYSKEML